jgi:hypothetical protein
MEENPYKAPSPMLTRRRSEPLWRQLGALGFFGVGALLSISAVCLGVAAYLIATVCLDLANYVVVK